MKRIQHQLRWRNLFASATEMGPGSYVVIAVLLGLLVLTGVVAGKGWSLAGGTAVPLTGYVAMALGVVFSLLVGVGLMTLIFYSSRAGYDEPAKLIGSDGDDMKE